MRGLIAFLSLALVGPSWAADAVIKDADNIVINGAQFRLDGIDAPEYDQVCVDAAGTAWSCGIAARDHLAAVVGKNVVKCEDQGPDKTYPKRRVGICSIEGQATSLNQMLVQEGWALNFEPYAKGRFKSNEAEARDKGQGLWKGCFAAPQDFRYWRKNTASLLGTCPTGNQTSARDILFPTDPTMPPGCSIKGKFAARAAIGGYFGIYHTEDCGSYQRTKFSSRWFCSEEEAIAAGFRKSNTCKIK